MLNSVADLMQVLHDPATAQSIESLARDERALRWVIERTRESMADPERFFAMLAQPAASNMLSALRQRPHMLHAASKCDAPTGRRPDDAPPPLHDANRTAANASSGSASRTVSNSSRGADVAS